MHISLTPELESGVKAEVARGLYNNASDEPISLLTSIVMRRMT